MNQKGVSSYFLLFILVIGAVIIWELNRSVTRFGDLDAEKRLSNINATEDSSEICISGIEEDCNDSNDVFLLPE